MLVLSLFPGIDLLGRGFEDEGFCVVRGPDPLWGGDVRSFTPPAYVFHGVIGGPPCQDFSKARRSAPTGHGQAMLDEFVRCVEQAAPSWFLMENVPGVPDIEVRGYRLQRLDLRANEVGLRQRRLRHFQFGRSLGAALMLPDRVRGPVTGQAALASEGHGKERRGWVEFCALQGLPADYDLPGFTLSEKYRAVGNGVPVPMAAFLARAIKAWSETAWTVDPGSVRLCLCGCGRQVSGKQVSALPACRKRLQRRRSVTLQQVSTLDQAQ